MTKTPRTGRPPKAKDELLNQRIEVRLTGRQATKLAEMGGVQWIRDRIDKAKPRKSD